MDIPFHISTARDLLRKASDVDFPALQLAIKAQNKIGIAYALFDFAGIIGAIMECYVNVPRIGRVRITAKRMKHKRGRSTHYFWAAKGRP